MEGVLKTIVLICKIRDTGNFLVAQILTLQTLSVANRYQLHPLNRPLMDYCSWICQVHLAGSLNLSLHLNKELKRPSGDAEPGRHVTLLQSLPQLPKIVRLSSGQGGAATLRLTVHYHVPVPNHVTSPAHRPRPQEPHPLQLCIVRDTPLFQCWVRFTRESYRVGLRTKVNFTDAKLSS